MAQPGVTNKREGPAEADQLHVGNWWILIFVAGPGRALAVAMVAVMAVALVKPGSSNAYKKRSGEASANPLRDSREVRLRIADNLDLCIHGFPQRFETGETATAQRLEFLMILVLESGRLVRAKRPFLAKRGKVHAT